MTWPWAVYIGIGIGLWPVFAKAFAKWMGDDDDPADGGELALAAFIAFIGTLVWPLAVLVAVGAWWLHREVAA